MQQQSYTAELCKLWQAPCLLPCAVAVSSGHWAVPIFGSLLCWQAVVTQKDIVKPQYLSLAGL